MSDQSKPFFRADHVGSLLRPKKLLEARASWKGGKLTFEALQNIEDEAIREVVKLQENVGLKAITDGEFRRENWWVDFISQIEGIVISEPDVSSEFKTDGGKGSGYIPKVVKTVSKITHNRSILDRDFETLLKHTKETPKVTIPSPTRIHFHGGRAAVDLETYPDLNKFWSDIARFYQDEIAALEQKGCRYIQIDDPVLTYFLDERMRNNLQNIGENPDALINTYATLLNDCIRNRRDDTYLTMHLCRGNALSSWIVSGGYAGLANSIFPNIDVDSFFLEYDDERSGDFAPLDLMPNGKKVVLGLVTSKRGQLETADSIKRRIEEASKIIPLENLALSPQCGFASVDVGNLITLDDQMSKLELVVKTAETIWGNS
ncbi:MAG TPA: 5-methyltetrahydropteroyltriglutamate--homocysteine S-methyltransferase [Rhodospirillales bacterium]|nr:5-methyltetrahydropteroyltriglutamate--homocysteine S-methyltransferase [Rhodospirillales bacterium]